MAKLSLEQCRRLTYRFFLHDGWLPPGTTEESWDAVRMGELGMDDPPLPGDPHLQKKRVAAELQQIFFLLDATLPSPLPELKKVTRTLGELASWCHENQE